MTNSVDVLLAAALCEQVYRRDPREQAIGQLTGQQLNVEGFTSFYNGTLDIKTGADTIDQLKLVNNAFYYNDNTGFVGQIVEANNKVFVVLRGTDLSSDFTKALESFFADSPQSGNSYGQTVDTKDWYYNHQMGIGSLAHTQIDDALALLKAAKIIAGSSDVIVTGQSLGGGLAALATAINNADGSASKKVKGITVAQAPFGTMLEFYRGLLTLNAIGITKTEVANWEKTVVVPIPESVDPLSGQPTTVIVDRDNALTVGGTALELLVRYYHPEKFWPDAPGDYDYGDSAFNCRNEPSAYRVSFDFTAGLGPRFSACN
jgi:pimeloyl-ACP methyl ester carboxylesterase